MAKPSAKKQVRKPIELRKPQQPQPVVLKFSPRNARQSQYLDLIAAHDYTFGLGPAGTGKTFLAVAAAVEQYLAGKVQKIVLVRPVVESGEKLGFLPGTFQEKVDPYLFPLYDALNELLPREEVKAMFEDKRIEIAALAFMRGRTFKKAFVILDEAQNTTVSQMKMALTRIGAYSKMVITGDLSQSDLPRHVKNGLAEAIRILEPVKGIGFCGFSGEDIVRHRMVERIVEAFEADSAPAADLPVMA